MTPEELAAIRERDGVWGDGDGMPTDDVYHDRRALLAHIDALDPQIIEAALSFYRDQMPRYAAYAAAAELTQDDDAAVMVDVKRSAAVLAILRGER